LLAGVVLAFPWILYQMWRFISPGLSSKEQGYSVLFVTVSSLLLFAGALFGYYLIVPLSLRFLGNYVLSGEIQNIIETASYLNTVMSLILATGIMFELPILVFFLSRMGLTTAKGMKTYRRHAWIGILMLSAVITPPDVFSQILISIPVFLLYEVSILVSKYAAPKS
jgi:sec-independent protein translocase protein TatC